MVFGPFSLPPPFQIPYVIWLVFFPKVLMTKGCCVFFSLQLFDVAGLACGHFGMSFWTFFGAVFIGKALIKVKRNFCYCCFEEGFTMGFFPIRFRCIFRPWHTFWQ
jgi:hypothetical protein